MNRGQKGGLATNIKCSGCGYFMNVVSMPDGRFWIVDEHSEKVLI